MSSVGEEQGGVAKEQVIEVSAAASNNNNTSSSVEDSILLSSNIQYQTSDAHISSPSNSTSISFLPSFFVKPWTPGNIELSSGTTGRKILVYSSQSTTSNTNSNNNNNSNNNQVAADGSEVVQTQGTNSDENAASSPNPSTGRPLSGFVEMATQTLRNSVNNLKIGLANSAANLLSIASPSSPLPSPGSGERKLLVAVFPLDQIAIELVASSSSPTSSSPGSDDRSQSQFLSITYFKSFNPFVSEASSNNKSFALSSPSQSSVVSPSNSHPIISEAPLSEVRTFKIDCQNPDTAQLWMNTLSQLARGSPFMSNEASINQPKIDQFDIQDYLKGNSSFVLDFSALERGAKVLQRFYRQKCKYRISSFRKNRFIIKLQSVIRRKSNERKLDEARKWAIKCQSVIRCRLGLAKLRQFILEKNVLKYQTYRTSVIMELYATENTYVSQLSTLNRVFYKPLKALFPHSSSGGSNNDLTINTNASNLNINSPSGSSSNRKQHARGFSAGSSVSSPSTTTIYLEHIQAIFGNVEEILEHHKGFLNALKHEVIECWNEHTVVSKPFLEMSSWLGCYVPYCINFEERKHILNKCIKHSAAFSNFVKTAEQIVECNKLDLNSFLILPIQRIPRYELLLKDLVKHTWNFHPDYDGMITSLQKIREAAKEMNRSKQYEKSKRKIESLQKKIYHQGSNSSSSASNPQLFNPDLQPTSRYVNEGRVDFVFISQRPVLVEEGLDGESNSKDDDDSKNSSSNSPVSPSSVVAAAEDSSKPSNATSGYIYLFSDHLIVSKVHQTSQQRKGAAASLLIALKSKSNNGYDQTLKMTPVHVISLFGAKVIGNSNCTKKDLKFTLENASSEQLFFWCDTVEDKKRWLSDLSECIEECSQNYWKSKFDNDISNLISVDSGASPTSAPVGSSSSSPSPVENASLTPKRSIGNSSRKTASKTDISESSFDISNLLGDDDDDDVNGGSSDEKLENSVKLSPNNNNNNVEAPISAPVSVGKRFYSLFSSSVSSSSNQPASDNTNLNNPNPNSSSNLKSNSVTSPSSSAAAGKSSPSSHAAILTGTE